MAFGFAGAASGATDALQEMLARAFAEKQAQEQLALQQAASRRQSDQAALQRDEFNANQAYRQGQVERQGRLDDVAATERRQTENERGVRRMIGDFLIQRGGTPLDQGARQTLTGMGISEGVDLPKQIVDDPTAANAEWERRQGIEHKNRLGEIGAAAAEARRTAAARPPTAASEKAATEKQEQARNTALARQQLRDLAQSIYDDAGLEGVTGPIQGFRDTFFEPTAVDVKRRLDQLTNKLSLDARGLLKGQGQISNYEAEMLAKSVSSLDRRAGKDITRKHLKEIIDAVSGDAPGAIPPKPGDLIWDPVAKKFVTQ